MPSAGKGGGILSEEERSFLSDQGVTLAPGTRENSFVERFYLYLHLTKPSERLYLTMAKADLEGKAMRPSYVVGRIQRLFPELSVTDEEADQSFKKRVWTPENGLSCLTEGILKMKEGEFSPEFQELYLWYSKEPKWKEKLERLLHAAFAGNEDSGIGREAAKALYGNVLTNSVSRLETFAACACEHFLRYGLRLTERETLEFAPVDMGNLLHKALEIFSEKVEASEWTWFDTIWALLIQIRSGMFEPGNFEVPFSAIENLEAVNLSLPDNTKMKLKGRIDRIDYCENEEEVFVKVVDYKSGNTKFDLAAFYYGLQLQLMVYLNAALELERRAKKEKTVTPAGIFYYHVEDPLLELSGDEDPDEIRKQLLKELKVNGLVNSREEIIKSMDRFLQGTSSVIPVSVNKDGSLGKASRTASTKQFAAMSAYAGKKMQELGSEILKGKAERLPYERKNQTACDYCVFRSVCGFDLKDKSMKFRRLEDLSADEALRKIEEEMK